jgi:hypothetical protein
MGCVQAARAAPCGVSTERKLTRLASPAHLQDWKLPELQQRYRGHFLEHIATKIAQQMGTDPVPLQTWDGSSSRWMCMRAGEEPRHPVMQRAARGVELEILNRQAAILIAEHGLKIVADEKQGDVEKTVITSAAVAKGELVMLLPPNLLLLETEVIPTVGDFNKCLQLPNCGTGASAAAASVMPTSRQLPAAPPAAVTPPHEPKATLRGSGAHTSVPQRPAATHTPRRRHDRQPVQPPARPVALSPACLHSHAHPRAPAAQAHQRADFSHRP